MVRLEAAGMVSSLENQFQSCVYIAITPHLCPMKNTYAYLQCTLNENNVHTMENVYRMQIKCSQIFLKAFIQALPKEREMAIVHIKVSIWEVKFDSDFREIMQLDPPS